MGHSAHRPHRHSTRPRGRLTAAWDRPQPARHPESQGMLIRCALAGEANTVDATIVDQAGVARQTQASYIPRLQDGRVSGFSILVTDIAAAGSAEAARAVPERRDHEIHLVHLASQDPLTGLVSRRAFTDVLGQALLTVSAGGGQGALVILDLDHFKAVNDTFGRPAGDAALVRVANILKARVRPQDLVGRLGGDEFAVLLSGPPHAQGERIATEFVELIRSAQLGVPAEPVTASVGVVELEPGAAASDMLARADAAMYRAKRNKAITERGPSGWQTT